MIILSGALRCSGTHAYLRCRLIVLLLGVFLKFIGFDDFILKLSLDVSSLIPSPLTSTSSSDPSYSDSCRCS